MTREIPKVKVFIAKEDLSGSKEYTGTMIFTDGEQKAENRIFEITTDAEGQHITIDIPIEAIFAEMRRSLRGE